MISFPTRISIKFSLALVLALLMFSTSLSMVSSATSQGNALATTKTAPVSIHFKPKHVHGVEGSSVTITGIVENKGTLPFTATSCELWTDGVKALTCLVPSDFPHTFPADSKTTYSGTQSISKTCNCVGTYTWKIILNGTYNGVATESHAGVLKVTITA